MEDTNHQDDEAENGGDIAEEVVEDSDDEDEDYSNRLQHTLDGNVLQRLKQNDPAVSDLYIQLNCDDNGEYYFNSINWKDDGNVISNNKQLKRIHITYDDDKMMSIERHGQQAYILGEEGHNLPTRQQLQDFFSCLYRNSSIETICITSISIVGEFGGGFVEGLCGHPSLKRLEIGYVYDSLEKVKVGSIGCEAFRKVLQHPESKLKHLRVSYTELDDQGLGILCDGLVGNSTIKRFFLDGNKNITSAGWRALAPVLQHTNCKLTILSLKETSVHDEGVNILGSALHGSSLKFLNLALNNSISSSGWRALLNHLSQTLIETLNLSGSKIDDVGLDALSSIGTLKSLTLCGNGSISQDGWRSFFEALQTRGIQLMKLNVSNSSISATALSRLLSNMSTLKYLCTNYSSITSQGWVSLLTSIQDSNVNLEKLDLSHCSIDDEGLQLLVPLVSNMDSLKYLGLSDNVLVSTAGWQTLVEFFQSPNFVLEQLDIGENNLNDNTLIPLTSALVNNKTLQRLYLEESFDEDTGEYFSMITERGWDAVSNLICNKSSIMDTYNSNHILHDVYCEFRPDDLIPLLELNKNKDKFEVARQKILQTHFSDDGETSKLEELLDMELEMLPTVIAWMGSPTHADWRGGTNVSSLSAMYNLMRRVPDLFDSSPPQKKPSMKG